jgi:uncharacterized OsmC-like protein
VTVSDDQIREALERNAKAVALRPAIGRKTGRTSVRLNPGLECEVTDGRWTLAVGIGPNSGGTDAGPGPGVLGRGALGSCLALGYAMWAARLGVKLDSVEVVVEADYDTRGELGVADEVPPGYTEVRYLVTVVSGAPEGEVRRVIDTADRYSPYRDVFARANQLRRDLRIVAPT